ncbi:endonuclease/exonuclease/phosphatase family protein [Sphingomonas sabuli]|uniref:Endonuclease/exonuclease/phosphatase family protein n=2 Tax=Sphingomonas sabuli TaxID=2764186 RepID=A0A7G9L617_9SPHN|nr:endonuclease/exonuclease/phosphatase family protein [Sphingomonas sabuli]QNM84066.1 endonuclease/exonuclease/phosphatase family protein [Sphingomonas sabuli]
MRKAIGTDRKRNPGRVLEVLRELEADIVALQEADRRFGGRASAVPHELIESHGLYKPVHLGVRHKRPMEKARQHAERIFNVDTRNIGWHGNALLVKRDVECMYCVALELPTLEPRGAVMAELLLPGDRPVRVVGMHLDLSGLWRRRQMRAILDAVAARPQPMPTIMMGDTNEWRVAGGCLKELPQGFRIVPTGPSFHSRHPVAMLDRIIVDGARIDAGGVHMSPAARIASDHLPIWARLSF